MCVCVCVFARQQQHFINIPPHLVAAVGYSGAAQNSLKDIQPRRPKTGYKLFLCLNLFDNFYIISHPTVCAYCLCLCTLLQDLVFCSSAVH